jgi:hypothetical protein
MKFSHPLTAGEFADEKSAVPLPLALDPIQIEGLIRDFAPFTPAYPERTNL